LEQSIGEKLKIGGMFTSLINQSRKNFVYGADLNFTTNEFMGDKNLIIAGRFAQTNTSDKNNNHNNAISLGLVYPNNFIETGLIYTQIQNNFNAELGFVNRTNIKNLSYNLELRPRLNNGIVKNFYFQPISLNSYWTDETNQLESMSLRIVPFGISFSSGDFISININRKYDRLDQGFSITDGFDFGPGMYWFNNYSIEINTYGGRPLTSWLWAQFGKYYDADYLNLHGFWAYNFNANLNVNASYSLNKLTKNSNEFVDHKITTRIDYSFNPKLGSSLYAQYSDYYDEILINFRINWIPIVGSDLYFVVNQSFSRTNPKWTLENTTIISKFIWRFQVI